MGQPKPAENPPILFGGTPAIPPPEVFEKARRSNPLWYQVLEAAYEKFATAPERAGVYADPKGKGATLEQVWLFFTTLGVEPWCLLAYRLPDAQVQQIARLQRLTASQIIDHLKAIQKAEGQINATTLHYDGKTGHCIRITSWDADRDRFVYHDPWPDKSLLCEPNNMAGVKAQPEGKRWSVTGAELERVLFASFLFPHQWARLQGVDFDRFLDDWKKSDFFGFFHLKRIGEESDGGTLREIFTAGPFSKYITLAVDHRGNGKIVWARLLLDKGWMQRNVTLALDIGKSFIAAFAPPPDSETYGKISSALWALNNPSRAAAMRDGDPEASDEVQVVHAFMGSRESASVHTDFSSLALENQSEGAPALEIEFSLF